ncbi:MAG: alpha/beta fold hydrolase [Pseudomonadales bacterium]|jgi:dipeptidyl aminopeptidase/acylaminoacyl peptidase|nr:alpha/beta fold hydrolase [Pseudomonadales bacterium]
MSFRLLLGVVCSVAVSTAQAAQFDAAAAFGARPSTYAMSMSPDGSRVAFIEPTSGQGAVLYVAGVEEGAAAQQVIAVNGESQRLSSCSWVASDRLACELFVVVKDPSLGLLPMSRLVGINADGSNVQLLSTEENRYSRGLQLNGGSILDWLPDENGVVLMQRRYLPDDHTGSRLGSTKEGFGVDRLDTRTRQVSTVERPDDKAAEYLTDGYGAVRVMGVREIGRGGYDTGVIHYRYRLPNSRDWKPLGDFDTVRNEGLNPYAVDRDLNVVYGLKKKDGRTALYTVKLDGSLQEELVYARPDVDINGVFRIGRRQRVVAAAYTTDRGQLEYLSQDFQQMMTSLHKAIPNMALNIVDVSTDENKVLLFAGSDTDPGVYYILDRKANQLRTFLVARAPLEGVTLATMKPISYPAADGTLIPGYLTLPPGRENAKGLPAIVLPHGGPSSRDQWGFGWLSQFFANRGFVVLQPNFRGSAGYGDDWFLQNGFQSWKIAIGDVLDAGRWLIQSGYADPNKLGVFGWSYGGYAALQSAVVDTNLFKAVVAVAPVTDLAALREEAQHWSRVDANLFKAVVAVAPVTDLAVLKEEAQHWSNYKLVLQTIGDGPHVKEGSPAQRAGEIKVPVLLFHGGRDVNVDINESQLMDRRLREAGGSSELVTWDNLDHQLEDSAARALMLSRSEAFLLKAFGL